MEIIGTGRELPKRRVLSSDLDKLYKRDEGYFFSVTGVETRYFCEDESQIDLATSASQKALSDAGVLSGDVDLIISAAAVPYQPIPATAPAVQYALGVADGECFSLDINCTCLGFAAALQFAESMCRTGKYQTILIVSSEVASRALPWTTQPQVAGLFGDGAAACVVRQSDSNDCFVADFATYPSAYNSCSLAAGGTRFDFEEQFALFSAHSRFTMDGKELFRLTAKHFAKFVQRLLKKAGTTHTGIDRVIAHQASPGALAHMTKLCGFEQEQVINIASQFGNQIAASIPFTLDYVRELKLLERGDRVLMLGTSAGVSFGGIVMDL
ncbi:MAG: ketoacyl-ACP synthase III [Stappiaceae bacterium]